MPVALVFSRQLAAAPAPIAQGGGPPPLTLAQAAAAIAESTEAAWPLAGRVLNPSIDFRTENWGPGDHVAPRLDIFAVLSQPIELGVKREARREVAVADRSVAMAVQRDVERRVALETVRLYAQAFRARSLVDPLISNGAGFATLVQTMARRVEEGDAAESDLLKFKTEAARCRDPQRRLVDPWCAHRHARNCTAGTTLPRPTPQRLSTFTTDC